jgi:ASC-1-like (ASCH) protein
MQVAKIHEWFLSEPWFTHIMEGRKIYETRVNDERRRLVDVQDIIKFTNRETNKTFTAKVAHVMTYRGFEDAILATPLDQLLPGIETYSQAITIYNGFPHSGQTYKEAAAKYGVVRFTLERL